MMQILKSGMKNGNTAFLGVVMIALAVLNAVKATIDNDPLTTIDFNMVSAEIIAGVGLILARDANKTSEDSGATPKI